MKNNLIQALTSGLFFLLMGFVQAQTVQQETLGRLLFEAEDIPFEVRTFNYGEGHWSLGYEELEKLCPSYPMIRRAYYPTVSLAPRSIAKNTGSSFEHIIPTDPTCLRNLFMALS